MARPLRAAARASGILALLVAAQSYAQAPWIITTPVTISTAADHDGDVYVASGGELSVVGVPEPGFRLRGNLVVAGTGRVRLADSVIQIMSSYHGQYLLVAGERTQLTIERCDYRVPAGVQHAIVASGDATVTIAETDFGSVQLIANVRGSLVASRLNGRFETILQDGGRLTLRDIPRDAGRGELWVWPTFGPGSRAVFSPPLPGFVDAWSFPPVDSSGITQSCEVTRCQVKLWPLLVREGSDLTLRDIATENWVVVGLHLPASATLENVRNGLRYEQTQIGLPDRRLALERAAIRTWNLYPEIDAVVTLRHSTIGELIAADRSRVEMADTLVDGSGGYFGANGDATIVARACDFTCDVQASRNATISLAFCRVLPYPFDGTGALTRFGAFDTARLLLFQTASTSTSVAGGSGLLVFCALADPPSHPPWPGARFDLRGTIVFASLDAAMTPGRWRVEAWPSDVPSGVGLGEGTGNVTNGPLGTWSGADPYADSEIRVTLTDAKSRALGGAIPVARNPRVRRGLHHP